MRSSHSQHLEEIDVKALRKDDVVELYQPTAVNLVTTHVLPTILPITLTDLKTVVSGIAAT